MPTDESTTTTPKSVKTSDGATDPAEELEQSAVLEADKPTEEQDTQEAGESESIKKRIARAQEAGRKKLLAELGIEDPAEAKELLEGEKKRREGEMSALQKSEAALKKAQDRIAQLEEALKQITDSRRAEKLNAAVSEAAKGAKHPEDVIAWLRTNEAEALAGVLNEDLEVDDKHLKALVAKVQKARPDWFSDESAGVPSNGDAKTPANTTDAKALSAQAAKNLRSFFAG